MKSGVRMVVLLGSVSVWSFAADLQAQTYRDPVYTVDITRDVVYGTGAIKASSVGGTKKLRLDVYSSHGLTASNRPAMLLVHGGGFVGQSKKDRDMVEAGSYYAARGWTCFSIDYRLVKDDPPAPLGRTIGIAYFKGIHAAIVDTKKAVRWIRANAATYGIQTNRLAGLGHSAGAYCALMSAVSDETDYADDAGGSTPPTNANFSGAIDVCISVAGSAGLRVSEFDSMDSPILVWHGTGDRTVPYSYAKAITNACATHGIPYKLCSVPGVDHGKPTWSASFQGKRVMEHGLEFAVRFLIEDRLTADNKDERK